MNDELTQVVDAVADKLGLAATKLQPVAEEVVREVALAGWVGAATYLAAAVLVLYLALAAHKVFVSSFVKREPEETASSYKEQEYQQGCEIANAVSAVVCWAITIIACPILLTQAGHHVAYALSPTYTLLRSLM